MIEFGKTLREAREAKGLTISQVAETTRIMHSIVEGLESENFSGIPAPIYGRGFVKLYCEAVGLDPKPMVAEFMEIYNGNRDVAIKERPRASAPAPAPVVETPIAAEPVRPVEEPQPEPQQETEEYPADKLVPEPEEKPASSPFAEPDLFSAPEMPEPKPFSLEMPEPEQPTAPEPAIHLDSQSQSLSRYAAPVRQRPDYRVPQMFGRWAALALGAAVVLAIVVLGLRALYRATSTSASDIDDTTAKATEVAAAAAERHETAAQKTEAAARKTEAAAKKAEAAAKKPEASPRKDRTPQDIPSLYID